MLLGGRIKNEHGGTRRSDAQELKKMHFENRTKSKHLPNRWLLAFDQSSKYDTGAAVEGRKLVHDSHFC